MSSRQPFFSIVIPTKNRPEYLRESIQSVLLQDFTDYELIVSDNFNDKTLIERHRLVYDAMGELMKHEIHALSMKTLTSDEWEE